MAGDQLWFDYLGGEETLAPQSVAAALAEAGLTAGPAAQGIPSLPGIVFLDQVNPEVCERLRQCSQNGLNRVMAVAVTPEALTTGAAWSLLEAGACDVFSWTPAMRPAETVARRFARWRSVDELIDSPVVLNSLVGRSPAWLAVLRQVVEVARFTDASVLIIGESGTGKELIGRLMHALDPRTNKRDLVVLDCTTIVAELSGSEFFGHERGAFTHAYAARDGAFALADGGTLFLDEVGELPLPLQAELLRVVQERSYKRVGSNTWKETNFRLVCATNRDLLQEEANGRFRRDLFFRIASWVFKLPSLSERREDILPLAEHFLTQYFSGREPPGPAPELTLPVRDFLSLRDYPGNVRELRQLVLRMAQRHVGDGPITVGDLPEDERPKIAGVTRSPWHDGAFENSLRRALSLGVGLKRITTDTAELVIRVALADEGGNLQRAAQRLGVTDRALQMRRAATRQNVPGPGGNGEFPS